MKVSTHTHFCIKIRKVIALEHKEMKEDHEPTKEYSYNHKKIIEIRKDKTWRFKVSKREMSVLAIYIYKNTI